MTSLTMTSLTRGWSGQLSGWRDHLTMLALLSAAIILLFARDAADMAEIWWTSSTFSHCLFIPLLIGWMVQQRMYGLRLLTPDLWRPGLIWLLAGNLIWLVGEAGSVGMFRHLGLVVMLQGATISLLGASVARALIFPLFYAFFMVPFGADIVPPLQLLTAKLAMTMLALAQVPAHIEGIFITTANGYFEVAEACSGAKFVIAMAAYGVLVCHICFRSWLRRAVFLTFALGTSILANGVRAFATIYVAHRTTIDAAIGFDHVVYGGLFFAVVMLIVMACAWPFFDRKPTDPWFNICALQEQTGPVPDPRGFIALAIACILFAPAWMTLAASRVQPLPPLSLPHVEGWTRSYEPMRYPWRARFDGADYFVQARYRDASGHIVDLAIATFAQQHEGKELVGFGQGAVAPKSEWVWSSPAPAPGNSLGEQISAPGPVARTVVSFYALGSEITGSASQVKFATLKARLLLGDQRAVAILVSAEDAGKAPAQAAITAFLHAIGDPKELADASLGNR